MNTEDKIDYIPLENLLLDKANPRIHQEISTNITQLNLAKFIYDEFGIGDLKDSILKNGYFPVEPMVVIPSKDETDKFVVVEGNRRLATIKILCDEEYRNYILPAGRRDSFIANEELKNRLLRIPVVIAQDKDSVTAYLGVRHLGGVVRWEPLAQSKYVYNQVLSEKKKITNRTVKDSIEKFVQDTNNSRTDVFNLFYKYCIYLQMRRLIDENKIPNTIIENKFSLLEVAFGKTGVSSVAKYIGIESYSRLDPEQYENIIPEDKLDHTKNLIKWVFSENPPIQESRHINQYLKPILSRPESTLAFEKGDDKESALLLSDSYDNIILKSCSAIHKSLTHIQQNWANTKPESREDLKNVYKANVVDKVDFTNKTLDVDNH